MGNAEKNKIKNKKGKQKKKTESAKEFWQYNTIL